MMKRTAASILTLPPQVNKPEAHIQFGEREECDELVMFQLQKNHNVHATDFHGHHLFVAADMQHKQPKIVHRGKNGYPFHCSKCYW